MNKVSEKWLDKVHLHNNNRWHNRWY